MSHWELLMNRPIFRARNGAQSRMLDLLEELLPETLEGTDKYCVLSDLTRGAKEKGLITVSECQWLREAIAQYI